MAVLDSSVLDSFVLVTGAGGFVGFELVKNLRSKNIKVRALIRNEAQRAKLEKEGAEVVIGDIKNKDQMLSAVKGVEKIFHIAALFRQAGLPDSEYYKVNLEGTRNLLDSAIANNVEHFIHCSTVGVHGNVENPPADENTPFGPGDIYQITKLEGEKLVLKYAREGKLNARVIRPAMIYGPNDSRMFKLFKMIANQKFFYVGHGNALVHFVDVRDLAEAFYLAGQNKDVSGEVFIVAGESPKSLKEMTQKIAEIYKVKKPWLHLPVKPMQWLGVVCETVCTPFKINPPIFKRRVDFFTKNRSFNSEKAKRILGYKTSKPFEKELEEVARSYVESGLIKL